ncbi:exopolyphosphatase/guanosine-5'-triphosphate,3'-diphosphate pyrophosphatase [Microbacterium halimionae]|uniref:Exopolyphosphatase/guanosine-5'-triphosphate, 3'-diphosphate pyrophosphatase n=1 Tax=Microbacterium halimionae TaxID=1526413 RepID=A0A7W3JPR2_9MICO|nr:Ppx/GppA family phosphatase [Microbacterium halimionae]MBA8816741.1 exopolyphosphatase/guanosine-5'-triphosphate,3'-diphosphate pyrophosphatase [Microbacterium halimionae]NII94963.1 exopolyphosphatase/guanosine-5'-triphosphate,3'-diphosphate pyrophosphatase [Microbacterium halimionae]
MRLGVLDIGSNTVNLLVADARTGVRPVTSTTFRQVLRLMRFLDSRGAINPDGVAALEEAATLAREAAEREGVEAFLTIATSALREATNGPETIARIEAITGVPLHVLDGPGEARYTFLAIRRWFGWSAGNILMLDIGGGSLEVAAGADELPDVALSVPLGAGRVTVEFLPEDPPQAAHIRRLRDHVREQLAPIRDALAGRPQPDHIVGSSKTIRSLARLAGTTQPGWAEEDRLILTRSALKSWIPRMAAMPAEARQQLPGITPERTFQIVGGAVVLHATMKALGVDELEVSPWALREGVLLRYLETVD